MTSSFFKSDKNLSKVLFNKKIKSVEHIDKDACIKISFSDDTYVVLDTMADKEFHAIPLVYCYTSSDEVIQYMV